MRKTAAIRGIASYLPERVLSNQDLALAYAGWDAGKSFAKTGIRERHIAGPQECASDLAVAAALRLFEKGTCKPADIDFLLFCTQSPDYFLPATACLLQSRLGLPTACGALDVNQGCSGFVYALSLAKGLIESGAAERVLLITADTYSKYIAPEDRSTRALFGDGAAAVLVTAVEHEREALGPFVFGTDGRGARELLVPGGGMRNRSASDCSLHMNGPEVFNFTIRTVPLAVAALLEKAAIELDQVNYFVFHQANRFMLDHLRQKLGIAADRFCLHLESCGNTVSSTIPMALESALERGTIQAGARVMLVGFGVGFSWAAAMMEVVG